MSDQKAEARRQLEEAMPKEIIEPMIRLHKRREKINLKLLPREVFILVGMLQMVVRHSNLPEDYEQLARNIVEMMIGEIANIEPLLEHYLLLGWNPDHDQPLSDRKGQ
jgi:hypothetical protein